VFTFVFQKVPEAPGGRRDEGVDVGHPANPGGAKQARERVCTHVEVWALTGADQLQNRIRI